MASRDRHTVRVLEVRLLGPVDLAFAGTPIPVAAARQRAVLALLALNAGRVVSTEFLIARVWGDPAPAAARSTLKSVIARLRRSLREAGGDDVAIVGDTLGYRLEISRGGVDVHRFEALVAEAAADPDPAAAAELLQGALGLWRGAALADVLDVDAARDAAAALEERRLGAVEDLAEAEGFVGREEDKAAVADLLARHRLVTVTGTGGVGKTRLALELARGGWTGCPDEICFVDLAAIDDDELIVPQISAALGIAGPPTSGAGPIEELVGAVGSRRLLIVLDNCEHLMAGAAQVVTTVLRRSPTLAVLTTSREPLGVDGEVVWRLSPLAVEPRTSAQSPLRAEAVALFLARARAFGSAAAPAPDEVDAVVGVCRKLDGIPLAIELAAARLRVMTVQDLAARLDNDLDVLGGGPSHLPSRHRTMRACLDWGYDLLGEADRLLLHKLAVFVGGFDLAAVEAVASHPERVLDGLTRLVDGSWVNVESGRDGARFRLGGTVHGYATEMLQASGHAEAVARRHRDHYLALATSYRGAPLCAPRAWLGRASADYPNLRAALSWSWTRNDYEPSLDLAGHLLPLWALDGRFAEGRQWLERVLGTSAGSTPSRLWARVSLGLLVSQLGDAGAAGRMQEDAARDAAAAGEHTIAAYALGYRAGFGLSTEGPGWANPLWNTARAAFADTDDADGLAWCDFNLAFVALRQGRLDSARHCLENALAVGRSRHSDVLSAHAAAALASLRAGSGDPGVAADLAEEALAAARRLGLRSVLTMALIRAVEVALAGSNLEIAKAHLIEALQILGRIGGRVWVDDALRLSTELLHRRGGPLPPALEEVSADSLDAALQALARSC